MVADRRRKRPGRRFLWREGSLPRRLLRSQWRRRWERAIAVRTPVLCPRCDPRRGHAARRALHRSQPLLASPARRSRWAHSARFPDKILPCPPEGCPIRASRYVLSEMSALRAGLHYPRCGQGHGQEGTGFGPFALGWRGRIRAVHARTAGPDSVRPRSAGLWSLADPGRATRPLRTLVWEHSRPSASFQEGEADPEETGAW